MMRKFIILIMVQLFTLSCFAQSDTMIYAHRGFRGLMPENTIPAMINALHQGADVLEMDIAFTADKQAVLSHDPWLDYLITLDAKGQAIAAGKGLAIYEMTYAELRSYDVGSKQHPDFPQQQNFPTYIPRLADMIDSVEKHVALHKLPKPWYSIETKTSKSRDNVAQPAPEEFVSLLMAVLTEKGMLDRVIIQSFDERTLEIVHSNYPKVITMININKGSLEENLARFTFQPDFYAPIPELIDEELLVKLRKKGMRIIGGNTNDEKQIMRIKALGVQSYCTDYPEQ